ncbi:Cysteine protease ATG4D [Habropoda laboriosa]|uniref:Cysteine protease n=1 Tax=Habropoda laboriosa TaxID=597456 RepID=A0A0L7QU64_9HYME|nr:Cysteine protease ATG4D [Habropoda laboriosa]
MLSKIYLLGMNGQVQPSRERLGGFSNSTIGLFSGMIATDRVSNIQLSASSNGIPMDDSNATTEVDSKVKTKLLSMWNNVKYGWTIKVVKPNFSKESPVYLLGKIYRKKPEEFLEKTSEAEKALDTGSEISLAMDAISFEDGIEEFKKDFASRLWLTYRREFPILNGSTFTTDCGWGCMLRSGQMMLAQALVCHFLGRGTYFLYNVFLQYNNMDEYNHRLIIKSFGDLPERTSPFSIHTLVSLGALWGKRAGDWYGPSSVAHLLNQAVERAAERDPVFSNLAVYVAQDCTVYLQDIENVCQMSNGKWKSLILFVPLRLGADKLNPVYASCLTHLLTLDTCIGVIGGRPRHSLYFIGFQEDKLINLDPHYCQETVDVLKDNFPLTSFHCTSPRKMLISKMDPSCCVGFYFHNKMQFTSFMEVAPSYLVPEDDKVDYPMFLFCEGSGRDLRQKIEIAENIIPPATSFTSNETYDDDLDECEEFELLQ